MEPSAISAYLREHESKSLLRLITCGSVDDGKSTLIGRLLHDTQALFDDQLAALEQDSRRVGTQGEALDFALLLDGLTAEREQGITIDVAYRFFASARRKFIVADCPGHEQYTRNMATGASTADVALVLVDARKGVLTQTRRHSYICRLLGIRHVLLVVNKMDLVGHDRAVFEAIRADYGALAEALGIASVHCVPVSALHGDNLTRRSQAMPWYQGPTVLDYLETVSVDAADEQAAFRMPVQWVCRPHQDFRGFAGRVASGRIGLGSELIVLPSAQRARVKRIVLGERELDEARAGQSVMLVLDRELDVSRGDVLAAAGQPPEVADQFSCHVLSMSSEPLLPGRSYLMKIAARTVLAQITEIRHRIDVNSQQYLSARRLERNELAVCHLALQAPIVFEPYAVNRTLGSLILIDRISNDTVAAGMLDFALRRASNIHWQPAAVDKAARARLKGQRPRCLWFTGLSGSGKSTIANRVEQRLNAQGYHTYLLDGDNLRHGLNRDLGFTDEDRVENIRRVIEVARLMVDAGLIVLTAFISPFRAERRLARERFETGEFIEIYVDTPLAVCERRDPKGLYRKARAGQLPRFTGIDSPYEPPQAPELRLDGEQAVEALVEQVLARLQD